MITTLGASLAGCSATSPGMTTTDTPRFPAASRMATSSVRGRNAAIVANWFPAPIRCISVHVARRVGQFVPAGVPLVYVSKPECPRNTPVRPVEFGIVQIVDTGLRAISPAVNDPSAAISCEDQPSRIIIRWTSPHPAAIPLLRSAACLAASGTMDEFRGLLDTAFEQIRHYAVADVAVSLTLMRAYNDIAKTAPHADLRASLLERARRVAAGCAGHFRKTSEQRLAAIEGILAIDD